MLPKINRAGALSIFFIIIILVSTGILWPIQVNKVNLQMDLPKDLTSNIIYKVAALSLTNTTGDISMNLTEFNFNSTVQSTSIAGSSAILDVTINPEGEMSRVDLNIKLNGVNAVSPSFSGRLSSVTMTGYVIVDPKTNKLILSMVTSTSVLDIIRGILGF